MFFSSYLCFTSDIINSTRLLSIFWFTIKIPFEFSLVSATGEDIASYDFGNLINRL